MTNALDVVWVRSRDDFEALKPEWDPLVFTSAPTAFLTHSWLSNWLSVFGDRYAPRVLTARSDGRLVAALPLVSREGRGVRRWEIMGSGTLTPNHLDLAAEPRYRAEALGRFIDELVGERTSWDVLDLDKLPGDTPTAAELQAAFSARGYATVSALSASCPYAELPETYDAYMAMLSRSARRHTRERVRCLAREHPDAVFGMADSEEAVDAALDSLFRLHQQRWQARGYAGSFADRRVTEFHRSMAHDALREGLLRLYTITEGEHVISALLCYKIADTVQAYSCCFDPEYGSYRPGMTLGAYAIEQSIAESATRYDHLEGTESYKATWSGHVRENLRLQVFGDTVRGRLAKNVDATLKAAESLGRKVLPEERRESLRKLASRVSAR